MYTDHGNTIYRHSDGAWIPTDPGNRDYITYLEWLAAGNEPDQVFDQQPVAEQA